MNLVTTIVGSFWMFAMVVICCGYNINKYMKYREPKVSPVDELDDDISVIAVIDGESKLDDIC